MARCARKACRAWRPTILARHAHVGVTFNDLWFCSTRCLEIEAQVALGEAADGHAWVQPAPAPRVGRLLLHRQVVSEEALERALQAQRETGRRLGAELIAMGAASGEDVLRALAAQAGVGYVLHLDAERVSAGVANISRETVRALGVVPFDANPGQQRLRVACSSPLPGPALGALREMTGWAVEAFLVPDHLLQRLMDGYGQPTGSSSTTLVRTVSDAATEIARAAESRKVRRMQRVRCAPYVWVRLEGDSHAEDLLVTLDHTVENDTWQAAPTRH